MIEYYKHYIISHVIIALTADMLNFLYESLRCFEKRKFSVAFSLLRKPLKEHLFFLSWILADEDDFIARFESDNYHSFSNLSKETRLSILDKSIAKLPVKEAFDSSIVWDIIYSKKCENGFEPAWQRATHLTTSYGKLLKTEDYSLNFIFEDPMDDYYYTFLDKKLPYLFTYISQITLECFNYIYPSNMKTISHLIVITMGCYEALYSDGRSMGIKNILQKNLKTFLQCLHCKSDLKITKQNAAILYLHEKIFCKNCKLFSDFPLYWILSKSDMVIEREEVVKCIWRDSINGVGKGL